MILVLGAGVGLGRHIVADLLDRGHQIRAFPHHSDARRRRDESRIRLGPVRRMIGEIE